ncbi:AIM24 family protein [Pseudonocardia sp. EC080610-09]|uniref:AIM24 family protein n=1 Tax=unclassified Pseudonocardia TaxID=2619320 RepID=UPI000A94C908
MTALTVLADQGGHAGLTYTIDFRPTGALATLWLEAGRSVRAEAGAMVAMSREIDLTTELEGGLWSAMKRSAGGRSASVSTFTAQDGRGRLLLAPPAPRRPGRRRTERELLRHRRSRLPRRYRGRRGRYPVGRRQGLLRLRQRPGRARQW